MDRQLFEIVFDQIVSYRMDQHKAYSQMSFENLCTCFAPTLMVTDKNTTVSVILIEINKAISFMIIFCIRYKIHICS